MIILLCLPTRRTPRRLRVVYDIICILRAYTPFAPPYFVEAVMIRQLRMHV